VEQSRRRPTSRLQGSSPGRACGTCARLAWVHCAPALIDGTAIQGSWFDRTKEYSARQRGEEISPRQFAIQETVTLTPLPCWQHEAQAVIQERIRAMVETSKPRRPRSDQKHRRPSSAPKPCKRRNTRTARRVQRSPTLCSSTPFPAAFVASIYDAYQLFLAAFREAAEKLRSGDRSARFPTGSFPPGLPFVTGLPSSCAPGLSCLQSSQTFPNQTHREAGATPLVVAGRASTHWRWRAASPFSA